MVVGLFYAGRDADGDPAVMAGDRGDGVYFRACLTPVGAIIAASWRNLLGPLYRPFMPTRRWTLSHVRRSRRDA